MRKKLLDKSDKYLIAELVVMIPLLVLYIMQPKLSTAGEWALRGVLVGEMFIAAGGIAAAVKEGRK